MNDSMEEKTVPLDLETSSFSQVVFIDVPPSYPPNTTVHCFYTLTGGMEPNPRDWIGIFKVGWTSTKMYFCYVWVDPCVDNGGNDLKQHVLIHEYYLPKDDGEFYQFCYVDSSGQVRGASTPFCFQNPLETSLDSSLEKDLLVITTQEQAEQMEKEKEGLLHEMNHLKEENMILKNELDERLHEMHRLRVQVDQLKLSCTTESFQPSRLRAESTEEISFKQSHTFESETKEGQESHLREKYEKAQQKIVSQKQKITQLQDEIEVKEVQISKLGSMIKEAEQDLNRSQDQVQLLQVDVQTIRKDNERLEVEIQKLAEMTRELKALKEENKSLHAALSEQGPSEGDKNNTKVKIQALLGQLTEARNLLRKEMQNSNDANKRADTAEADLKELTKKLEQRKVTEDMLEKSSQLQVQLDETCKGIAEQKRIADTARLENEKLKSEVERLQKLIYDFEVASVSAVSLQQQNNSLNPPSSALLSTQEQQQPASHYYESITELSGNLTSTQNKVCRHCQESFPGISEDELETHEQSHKVCPFCTLICDDLNQQEFEDHVYSHEE